MEMEWN